MAGTPPATGTPTQILDDLQMRVSSIESKVRLNEQNVLNERRHVQTVDRNFLDFKHEIREKVDTLVQDTEVMKKTMHDLELGVKKFETRMKHFAMRDDVAELKKLQTSVNIMKPEMSTSQAKNILDSIVEKGIQQR